MVYISIDVHIIYSLSKDQNYILYHFTLIYHDYYYNGHIPLFYKYLYLLDLIYNSFLLLSNLLA